MLSVATGVNLPVSVSQSLMGQAHPPHSPLESILTPKSSSDAGYHFSWALTPPNARGIGIRVKEKSGC